MAKKFPESGGPEYSWWQQIAARFTEGVPSWVWIAGAVIISTAAVWTVSQMVGPTQTPETAAVTDTPTPATATPPTPTPTPDSGPPPFALAQATSDRVWVATGSGTPTPLPAPESRQIGVGSRVTVDERGQAILRFTDFLEVEVLREADLEVQELDISARSALAIFGQSGGAAVNNLLPAATRLAHRVKVNTDFALITATGTKWLVAKERNTPLEWVVALEAGADDLTVEADGVIKNAPTGIAFWVAPFGGPSIPVHYLSVDPWLESVRAGAVRREIGDALWPHADVITDTRSFRTYTETVASSGQNPPVIVLDDVLIELHPAHPKAPYELRDCNGDGIHDVYMEHGWLRFDFRGMHERVRALDAQVMVTDRTAYFLAGYNPANERLALDWVDIDSQLLSLRSDIRLQATDQKHQPFHYAELRLDYACFLGFSLTPPNPDDSPGPPRWPVPSLTPTATVSATATPTATVTPDDRVKPAGVTETVTVTATPTGSVTATPTAIPTGSVTVTPTATPSPTYTPTPIPTCVPRQPTGWVAYVVTSGETAQDIATERGVPLPQLIEVNCLRPPDYIIRTGQELWVPLRPQPAPPACATQAEITLSVRKISDDQVVISWASNCFVSGTVARADGFATTPLTLIVGQNGSKQIGLGRSCRVGETFIVFELWYAAGQKRTVTMQLEC